MLGCWNYSPTECQKHFSCSQISPYPWSIHLSDQTSFKNLPANSYWKGWAKSKGTYRASQMKLCVQFRIYLNLNVTTSSFLYNMVQSSLNWSNVRIPVISGTRCSFVRSPSGQDKSLRITDTDWQLQTGLDFFLNGLDTMVAVLYSSSTNHWF